MGTTGLPLRSFLRVDAVHEVPLEILEEQASHGRHLQLQEKSYHGLMHFMRQKQLV